MASSFTFSGHESFPCRQFWLKKGYDFVASGHKFSDDDSIVRLGVGKNMVTSIQFWMRSFGLLSEGLELTEIAHFVFGPEGKDPFLEDTGTLWLLHYLLVSTGRATIYQFAFNEFRKQRIEFTREQFTNYLNRKCGENDYTISLRTLRSDVDVLIRTYSRPADRGANPEDDFSSLLIDIDLIQRMTRSKADGGTVYRIESKDRITIPTEVILFAILQQNDGQSISFSRLMADPNNMGNVFALNRDGLQRHAELIAQKFPQVIFTDDAGIKEIQFSKRPDPYTVLDHYYRNAQVFSLN
ncbi:MAG: DUF4007 family protein [Chloroflexi bacterium]|nr:DUF4007 family protein [Chloroflexota bacterium]